MPMTAEKIKEIILSKKSYFKKGRQWLADHFNCSHVLIDRILEELKEEKRKYRYNTPNGSRKVSKISNIIEEQIKSLKEHRDVNLKSIKEKKDKTNKEGIHIVIGCLHVPFENKKLVNSICRFIEDYKDKIKGFHIIGDFLDLRSLSFHDKGNIPIMGITLGFEYKSGNEVLDKFEEVLPKNIDKSFLYGNHSDRYNRLISLNEVNQYSDTIPSPEEALHLKDRGFLVKTNWKEDYIQLGNIQLIHGIYCTQTPAKKHLTMMKRSVMFAHTHRIDTYYESDHGSFNIGCLVDIDSEGVKYLSRIERMNWKNGFGIIHLQEDGSFQADVIHCLNSSFFYGGKKY